MTIELCREFLRHHTRLIKLLPSALLLQVALTLVCSPFYTAQAAEHPVDLQDPTQVISAYLRATYARDYVEAYHYISTEDRKIRDLNRYVRERGGFNGFELETTRQLTKDIEIKTISQSMASRRIQLVTQYKVPALLGNLDAYQLNLRSAAEGKQFIDNLGKLIARRKKEGNLEFIQREETFDLVKESNGWCIFLDWAAGVRIQLQTLLSDSSELEVSLRSKELVVQPGDLFEVFLTIRNRSQSQSIGRANHLFRPRDMSRYVDIVECGFLEFQLRPGEEKELSGTYLLKGNIAEGTHNVNLIWAFRTYKR